MASEIARRIAQARGDGPADLVIKNTHILDLATGARLAGDVAICGDTIVGVLDRYRGAVEIDGRGLTVVPGFIDSHVHVESSLLVPAEFDRSVLPRGTTTAICDPHEIANVLGVPGLGWMLDGTAGLAMDLRVMLPSCVPATALETSGARLTAADLAPLADHPAVLGLAEMMNVPGLLAADAEVLAKLALFAGRHIDGHCPLVRGRALNAVLAAGIRTCHESTRLDEGREKLRKGMQLLIREGGVSKDGRTLAPLLNRMSSAFCGLCTDDRTPLDTAEEGHIDHVIRTVIAAGAPVAAAYRAASWSAAQAFGLRDRGLVAPGRRADLVLMADLKTCTVARVIKNGRLVGPHTFAGRAPAPAIGLDSVRLAPVTAEAFRVPAAGPGGPVIGLVAGSLITDFLTLDLPWRHGLRLPDAAADVQKVCVLCRHGRPGMGRGFVKGFGLRAGALASSVGHDSHNLTVVGVDDADMALAVNRLIALHGGFVAVEGGRVLAELPLPVAGLMSTEPLETVEAGLKRVREAAHFLGCTVAEPFLQLSFLPLPVIPHLKITDRGLVDVDRFMLLAA